MLDSSVFVFKCPKRSKHDYSSKYYAKGSYISNLDFVLATGCRLCLKILKWFNDCNFQSW